MTFPFGRLFTRKRSQARSPKEVQIKPNGDQNGLITPSFLKRHGEYLEICLVRSKLRVDTKNLGFVFSGAGEGKKTILSLGHELSDKIEQDFISFALRNIKSHPNQYRLGIKISFNEETAHVALKLFELWMKPVKFNFTINMVVDSVDALMLVSWQSLYQLVRSSNSFRFKVDSDNRNSDIERCAWKFRPILQCLLREIDIKYISVMVGEFNLFYSDGDFGEIRLLDLRGLKQLDFLKLFEHPGYYSSKGILAFNAVGYNFDNLVTLTLYSKPISLRKWQSVSIRLHINGSTFSEKDFDVCLAFLRMNGSCMSYIGFLNFNFQLFALSREFLRYSKEIEYRYNIRRLYLIGPYSNFSYKRYPGMEEMHFYVQKIAQL